MKILKILETKMKQNSKIHYLGKCLLNLNNNKFQKFVLTHYEDPTNIKILNYNVNQRKIIYLINEQGCGFGFFAEFRILLEKLLYADSLGLTPFVSYGSDYLYYEKAGYKNEKNAFLYYFEQISNVDINYNIVYASLLHSHLMEEQFSSIGYNIQSEFENVLAGIIKRYIRFNYETKKYLETSVNELLGNRKVISVHYRGTDYKKEYNKHPVLLDIDEIIEILNKKCEHYDIIFLATDDINAKNKFVKFFGNRIVYYKDVIRGSSKESVAFSKSNRENHNYKLGLEVLRDVYTISHCDALICGKSQVSIAARLLKKSRSEEFNQLIMIDKGIHINQNKYSEQV